MVVVIIVDVVLKTVDGFGLAVVESDSVAAVVV